MRNAGLVGRRCGCTSASTPAQCRRRPASSAVSRSTRRRGWRLWRVRDGCSSARWSGARSRRPRSTLGSLTSVRTGSGTCPVPPPLQRRTSGCDRGGAGRAPGDAGGHAPARAERSAHLASLGARPDSGLVRGGSGWYRQDTTGDRAAPNPRRGHGAGRPHPARHRARARADPRRRTGRTRRGGGDRVALDSLGAGQLRALGVRSALPGARTSSPAVRGCGC